MEATEKEQKMKCPLCGAEFYPRERACSGCPVRKDCEIVCCPNCGYGFPKESSVATWLKKRFTKQRSE